MLCFRIAKRLLCNVGQQLGAELHLHMVKKHRKDVQIVVVGAGLSGLSAASHLIKNGFTRTVVLEATERMGGRVNSRKFGDVFCELGAKWISIDASKFSIYELVQQASGLQKQIQFRDKVKYVNTAGEQANQRMVDMVDQVFRKLCAGLELQQRFKSGQINDLDNVHKYFQAERNKLINTLFKDPQQQIIASDIFHSMCKEFASLLGCCLEYVNIKHVAAPQSIKPTVVRPLYIPTGLDNLLYQIANNITPEHMQIGKPVGEIRWLDQKYVCCLDGSSFAADHIICTLPLGVLKNFSRYMFKPTLPKEKLRAISNLGFGSPIKIYFEYKHNIRPWFGAANIRPLWNATERKCDLNWMEQVVEISKLPSSWRVIEILIGGAFYDEIENLPDVEVLSEVTQLLRKCLRNPRIPYPMAMLRSNWSSSACYLGGRPYFAVESTIADINSLAAPLGNTPSLLFAGDATILQGFGTIDGARQSGIREAQRIIDYYQKLS